MGNTSNDCKPRVGLGGGLARFVTLRLTADMQMFSERPPWPISLWWVREGGHLLPLPTLMAQNKGTCSHLVEQREECNPLFPYPGLRRVTLSPSVDSKSLAWCQHWQGCSGRPSPPQPHETGASPVFRSSASRVLKPFKREMEGEFSRDHISAAPGAFCHLRAPDVKS